MYRKPTNADRYLYFKPIHSHRLKRGVVHSLVSRAKIICQDQNDFNKEIKNIRHDLMLNEYPQAFVDSIMKPSISNHSLGKTHQGMVIIPDV
jgi:hypothetical protein